MKKIISCLLAILLIFALCVPVFAEDLIQGYTKDYLSISVPGNYTIDTAGEYNVSDILIYKGCTLTVAEGVRINVIMDFSNDGTINLLGTIGISSELKEAVNMGNINIGDTGEIVEINPKEARYNTDNKLTLPSDEEKNEKVVEDIIEKDNRNPRYDPTKSVWDEIGELEGDAHGVQTDAKVNLKVKSINELIKKDEEKNKETEASVLSSGNVWIIVAISVVALGVVALIIVKKKKN